MAGNIKTLKNDGDVVDFINTVPDETKRADSLTLLEVFKNITGEEPKMWGDSIIGFGEYHYKSERSAQEGDWPLTGFSPRKSSLTLYIMPGFNKYSDLLDKLGKYKTSVSCLYIKKLADINMAVLKELIKVTYQDFKKQNS